MYERDQRERREAEKTAKNRKRREKKKGKKGSGGDLEGKIEGEKVERAALKISVVNRENAEEEYEQVGVEVEAPDALVIIEDD